MTFIIGTLSNGLVIVLSFSALLIGFGASYFVWQLALKNKSQKIVSEAEAEAEVIRKEKILQAKEKFLQLKTEHEKVINEKVLQYKQRYTDKDVQDFLAMASLQYVIKLTEEEEKLEKDYLPDTLKELIQKIDSVLDIKE